MNSFKNWESADFMVMFQALIQRGCDRKAVEENEKRTGLERGGFFVTPSYGLLSCTRWL